MSKKIKDSVKFDDKNFNIGTELGQELINKSISKFGYREASVLDKHGNIIGGNKRTQSALDNGITDIEIIKAEKGKVYALQFDDIDLDSPEGRELALALNATAKENINFDETMIFETIGDDIAMEWGFEVDLDTYSKKNKELDIDDFKDEMKLILKFTERQYLFIKESISKAGGFSDEDSLLKMLNYNE